MEKRDLKIAIVDDEKELTTLYSKVIKKMGYPVPSIFYDGSSIVYALAKDRQSFDVIIMDYRMPEMNGLEAAKIIKRYRKDTKIILTTAYTHLEKEALSAGLSFLAKPFSIAQLAECLQDAKPIQVMDTVYPAK